MSDALEAYITQTKLTRRKSPKIDENQTSLLTEALKSPLSPNYDPSLMYDGETFGVVMQRLEDSCTSTQVSAKNISKESKKPVVMSKECYSKQPVQSNANSYIPQSPVGFLELIFQETK